MPQRRGGNEKGVGHQPRREQHLRGTGDDEHQATVDVVGEGAAIQPEHHQRDELDDAQGTDREVGPGQLVELEGQGDIADHAAQVEHVARPEQEAEVTGLAQRGDVDAQAGQAFPQVAHLAMVAERAVRGANGFRTREVLQ